MLPFTPPVAAWFEETYGAPSDIQEKAWPAIIRGENVLLTAPTGSGKTLAAFLCAIDRLAAGTWTLETTRVLYVSPLKALNADIERNLTGPLAGIRARFAADGLDFSPLTVAVRSGDTPQNQRAAMLRHPPAILITTPESLGLILNSKRARFMLSGVRTVILDEIHALVTEKRGTYLALAMERLALLAGDFQRIMLSATVNPPEAVAAFGGGLRPAAEGSAPGQGYLPRPVTVIRSATRRPVRLSVVHTAIDPGGERSRWPALIRHFAETIARNRSTLIFVNSRRLAEKIAFLLNQEAGREIAWAHHGSLSREVRKAVEERMKRGELPAIVATNSLELGIDIGSVDEVILVQSPWTVAAMVQRVGRSGHRLSAESRGTLFPTHGADFLFAAVQVPAAAAGDIEPVRIPERPLDVLAQAIAGMAAMDPWKLDDLFAFVRTAWPYRELSRREFDLVIEMLAGRYAGTRLRELAGRVFVNREEGTIHAREGTLAVLYSSGGTIPDRGYYTLRARSGPPAETESPAGTAGSGSAAGGRIGELDEEFVWERKIGDTFALGTQIWRIVAMDDQYVDVVPGDRTVHIIPFWRGDALYRPYALCSRVLNLLDRFSGRFDGEEFRDFLTGEAAFDEGSAATLASFLAGQERVAGLPGHSRVVIERDREGDEDGGFHRIILHTLWGGRVNFPFAQATRKAAERQLGVACELSLDDLCILFTFTSADEADRFVTALVSGGLLSPENLLPLLREALEGSGVFGALFRANAGRSLLLPRTAVGRRVPLWVTRRRSKRLFAAVSGYGDFPVVLETWRQLLSDELDLEPLRDILGRIEDGEISFVEAPGHTQGMPGLDRAEHRVSPFARGVIREETDRVIYERDETDAGPSQLADDLVAEVMRRADLRPVLDAELCAEFERKVRRTEPGYGPEGPEETADWFAELRYVPADEWSALAARAAEGTGTTQENPSVTGPAAGCTADGAARLKAREVCFPGGRPAGFLTPDCPVLPAARELVPHFLRYRGPVTATYLAAALPYPREEIEGLLAALTADCTLVAGPLVGGAGEEIFYCDRDNYEALLRMRRRRSRPGIPVRPASSLQDFLAVFTGAAANAGTDGGKAAPSPGDTAVRSGDTDGPGAAGRSSDAPGPHDDKTDRLEEALERLEGYVTPAALWERDILPARVPGYLPLMLDALFRELPLRWFGSGRGNVGFCLEEDLDLVASPDAGETVGSGVLDRLASGPATADELAGALGSEREAVERQLWELAFSGRATTADFQAVRTGIAEGFRAQEAAGSGAEPKPDGPRDIPWPQAPGARHMPRSAFPDRNRWLRKRRQAARWIALPASAPDTLDDLDRELLATARVRILLLRYGVVFRELLERELPALQWRTVSRTLRRMELSGEITSGRFFEGIDGMQFASREAVALLRKGFGTAGTWSLSACDPASLSGVRIRGLPDAYPPRQPGTRLIFSGGRLALAVRRSGRELQFYREPGDGSSRDATALLDRHMKVETINGAAATESPFAPVLEAAGFERGYRTLNRY